jgi:hypothetical protein
MSESVIVSTFPRTSTMTLCLEIWVCQIWLVSEIVPAFHLWVVTSQFDFVLLSICWFCCCHRLLKLSTGSHWCHVWLRVSILVVSCTGCLFRYVRSWKHWWLVDWGACREINGDCFWWDRNTMEIVVILIPSLGVVCHMLGANHGISVYVFDHWHHIWIKQPVVLTNE